MQGAGFRVPGPGFRVQGPGAGPRHGTSDALHGEVGIRHYEDLIVWQLASQLRKRVVGITGKPDVKKDFRYCDQFRSAAASIPANIAEGFGRNTRLEFMRFLRYARGSAFETREWLRDGKDREQPHAGGVRRAVGAP